MRTCVMNKRKVGRKWTCCTLACCEMRLGRSNPTSNEMRTQEEERKHPDPIPKTRIPHRTVARRGVVTAESVASGERSLEASSAPHASRATFAPISSPRAISHHPTCVVIYTTSFCVHVTCRSRCGNSPGCSSWAGRRGSRRRARPHLSSPRAAGMASPAASNDQWLQKCSHPCAASRGG